MVQTGGHHCRRATVREELSAAVAVRQSVREREAAATAQRHRHRSGTVAGGLHVGGHVSGESRRMLGEFTAADIRRTVAECGQFDWVRFTDHCEEQNTAVHITNC